jgi:hypothetical protein
MSTCLKSTSNISLQALDKQQWSENPATTLLQTMIEITNIVSSPNFVPTMTSTSESLTVYKKILANYAEVCRVLKGRLFEDEGGVGGKGKKQSDIVSDISVGNEQVSLKNYTQIDTLDFGSLPSKELSELKYLFTIFSIISEEKLTSSLTRNSINSLFTKITSEEFLKIFEEFITVVKKHPNIAILQRIYNRIEPLLKASKPNIENSEDIKEIVNNFIKKINELIRSKIYKVNWWAVIKGGQQDIQNLYLLSSDEVFQKIISTDGQLNKAIKQFKGNNLGVNGNILLLNQNPTEEKSLDEDYYD